MLRLGSARKAVVGIYRGVPYGVKAAVGAWLCLLCFFSERLLRLKIKRFLTAKIFWRGFFGILLFGKRLLRFKAVIIFKLIVHIILL